MKTRRSVSPLGKLAAAAFCAVCGLLLAKSLSGDLRPAESTSSIGESEYFSQGSYLTGDGRRVEPTTLDERVPQTEEAFAALEKSEERLLSLTPLIPSPAEFDDLPDDVVDQIATVDDAPSFDASKTSIVNASWSGLKRKEWSEEVRLPSGFQSQTEFAAAEAPQWSDRGDAEFEAAKERVVAVDFEAATLGTDVVSLTLNQWKTSKRFFPEAKKRVEVESRTGGNERKNVDGASGVVMKNRRVGKFIARGSFEAGSTVGPNAANRY